MKPDEQRMRDVLVDTIRLLCRTGVEYSCRLRVQGLLGITVDDEHVFLIHVDDFITRNCTDVSDSLCEYADECNTVVGHGHINSDVCADECNTVASHGVRVNSTDHNVSQDIYKNCRDQHQHPEHLLLNQSTQSDILASVAISSVVAATSAEDRVLYSSQLLSQSTQNVSLCASVAPAVVVDTSRESVPLCASFPTAVVSEFAGSGSAAATESQAVVPDVPQTSVPTSSEPPVFIEMEIDAREGVKTEDIVVPAFDENVMGSLCMAAGVGQNRRVTSNLDDIDSSSVDTNDDSEPTSESDELPVVEQLLVPRVDVVSSLQYKPQALVGNVTRWHVASVQRAVSDGASDAVTMHPSVLSGVVQTGASHASAYYQQQVAVFISTPSSHAVYTVVTLTPSSHAVYNVAVL